jgi:Xaa-Pro aminopeptidase
MTLSCSDRLYQRLPSKSLDAVIYNPGPSMAYLTGVHFFIYERPIMAFFTPDRPTAWVLPAVEPDIYLTGRGRARVEDNVWVTGHGVESLSSMPRELVRVG